MKALTIFPYFGANIKIKFGISKFFLYFCQNNWDEWQSHITNKIYIMKIIYNKWIPFPGFCALTFGSIIFARKKYEQTGLSKVTLNHEAIHEQQWKDFGIWYFGCIIFYLWYMLEWILKLPMYFWGKDPYSNISFEREAFSNQCDLEYLKKRKRFAWIKRIFK